VTADPRTPVEQAVAGAAGRPLVVAVRDAYRRPEQAAWLQKLAGRRPDAVTVALGLPDDLDLVPGPAIATHGAARVCIEAAAAVLQGERA
jgi:beta-N-acetylhexosaminidase